MQWYTARNGQQQGPFSEEQIFSMIHSGHIRPDDLVWNESFGQEWKPAAEAPTLAGSFATTQQSAPPPMDGTGGATPNVRLMAEARAALDGKWGKAIAVVLLMTVINMTLNSVPVAGAVVNGVLSGPFSVGLAVFFISLTRRQTSDIGMLFAGFSRFGAAFLASLLMTVFVILWSLLLIIPGILAAYSYSMTFFILADDSQVGALEAIQRSKAMMDGRRWKLFCLSLRFMGWAILCVFTFGIGFLWLLPYMNASLALFYDDVKAAQA